MKKLFVPIFIISILLAISVAFAAGLELSTPASVSGFTTEDKTVDITIKNTQNKADTFTLSIFPSQLEKVTANLGSFLVTLASGEARTVKLVFLMPIDAAPGSINFEVTAKSTSDQTMLETKNVILNVQRITSIYIPKLSLEKYDFNPGEEVKISANVFNLEDKLSDKNFLKITVRKGTSVVKTFDESLDSIGATSSISITKSFNLEKYAAPGSYVIEAELRGLKNELKYSKSINFNVNTVTADPTQYRHDSSSYNILSTNVKINIKNEGNVNLPASVVTVSPPKLIVLIFVPNIEPSRSDVINGRTVYTWDVPQLVPGESYSISYRYDIWNIWLTLVMIAGMGYVAYKWLSKPKISKSVSHKGEIQKGKEIVIMLEVKNRAWHEIRNVEVVDLVSPIIRVIDKFDTLRPKARRTPEGIELRWRFESMKAGEERVLTYRVRPVVDIVGHLNLKSAEMIFTDNKKVKMSAVSKEAMVRSG